MKRIKNIVAYTCTLLVAVACIETELNARGGGGGGRGGGGRGGGFHGGSRGGGARGGGARRSGAHGGHGQRHAGNNRGNRGNRGNHNHNHNHNHHGNWNHGGYGGWGYGGWGWGYGAAFWGTAMLTTAMIASLPRESYYQGAEGLQPVTNNTDQSITIYSNGTPEIEVAAGDQAYMPQGQRVIVKRGDGKEMVTPKPLDENGLTINRKTKLKDAKEFAQQFDDEE